MVRIYLLPLLVCATGCATQAQLDGIAARAKIPQECRYIGTTPQISVLGGEKNLKKVVDAMGSGNVIIETGRTAYPGLYGLANTWWGELYDCESPTKFRGAGIGILSATSAHPTDPAIKEAAQSLRLTSNPEAVRGCQYVANVSDLTEGEVTRGVYPLRQAVMRYNAVKAGGDIVLVAPDGHTGEAYRCSGGEAR